MTTDWTIALTIKFLEEFKKERALWDITDKSYKLQTKVQDAWNRIGWRMEDIPLQELKMKKLSLMSAFRKLVIKKKVSIIKFGANSDQVYQPEWFAFKVMESFLGTNYDVEIIESDESDGVDLTHEVTIKEEPLSQDVFMDETNPLSDTMIPPLVQLPSIPLQSSKDICLPSSSIIRGNTIIRQATSMKRVIISKNKDPPPLDPLHDGKRNMGPSPSVDISNGVAKRKNEEENDVSKKKKDEDDCDLYGKLLATKLRNYPDRMRDRVMYKIDGLLLECPPLDNTS